MRIELPRSLVQILLRQIMPNVLVQGMDNTVVVRPSFKKMQTDTEELPKGVIVTHKTLKSNESQRKEGGFSAIPH